MINVVEQGISRNRCTKDQAIFNFARQLFEKSSLLPTKFYSNVAYVVIVLRSTYFAMLNVCWIEWWKECRSLQIPNLYVTQRFLFFLDSQCKLGISIAWFTVKELWHKKVKSWHQLDVYWVYNPSFHWSFSVETISNEIPNFQKVE